MQKMTIGELKNEVYAIAQPQGANKDRLFSSALRGALFTLYSDLQIATQKVIRISRQTPFFKISRLVHKSGEVNTLPLLGRAYSMRVCGKGSFEIRDGGKVKRQSFDTESLLYRDFISSEGEISFFGDYAFTVYDLSFYSEIYGSSIEDIPEGGDKRTVDFSKNKDFLAFISLPKNEKGKPIPGASYENEKLIIPLEYEGKICVHYLKNPYITDCDESAVLDISAAYRPLLVSLTASRLLTEEDFELSKRLSAEYQEMLKQIKLLPKISEYTEVRTNGWA